MGSQTPTLCPAECIAHCQELNVPARSVRHPHLDGGVGLDVHKVPALVGRQVARERGQALGLERLGEPRRGVGCKSGALRIRCGQLASRELFIVLVMGTLPNQRKIVFRPRLGTV